MATKTQTPLSPARAQLKQTLEAQQRARAIVDKSQKVADAAAMAVEQARAEAAKYDEAHEDVVKSRLAVLKGEEPAKSADEIREARRARLLAKEELLASDQVLEAATRELAEAHGNITRSEKVAASHATAVLSESASDVILAWDQVNQERERLRVILDSLVVARVALDALKPEQQFQIIHSAVSAAGLPFGDMQDWRHIQDRVGAALSRNYAQPDPGPGIARARGYWSEFASALLADPAVEQPQLPTADVLFS